MVNNPFKPESIANFNINMYDLNTVQGGRSHAKNTQLATLK